MVGTVLGDPCVILPEVLLAAHALDGRSLPAPDGGDVKEGVRLPAHLLRLVRLEEVDLRRAKNFIAGIVTPGLGDHPAFERNLCGIHVIGVVGIEPRVAEHEARLHLADHVDQPKLGSPVEFERVVAKIEKQDVMHIQGLGSSLGFCPSHILHLLQRHALLLPELRALAALAVRKTHHGDGVAELLMQRNSPPRSAKRSPQNAPRSPKRFLDRTLALAPPVAAGRASHRFGSITISICARRI